MEGKVASVYHSMGQRACGLNVSLCGHERAGAANIGALDKEIPPREAPALPVRGAG